MLAGTLRLNRAVPTLLLALMVSGCGFTKSQPATPTVPATPKIDLGNYFKHPPAMTINEAHRYTADAVTSKGAFSMELLPRIAPLAVNNFVFLARHKYYNNIIFHRVIASFMVQTGDRSGTGLGGPGYVFKDEPVHTKYTVGTVAMANNGSNTNGSQFFILVGSGASRLKPKYTIFGKVTRGMDVVQKIANSPVGLSPSGETSQPLQKLVLERVTIHESP